MRRPWLWRHLGAWVALTIIVTGLSAWIQHDMMAAIVVATAGLTAGWIGGTLLLARSADWHLDRERRLAARAAEDRPAE